jgi:hypothetical protein
MKNFEFKSQICTTKEQSERLLALGLKKETADMWHYKDEYGWRCSPYIEIWDEEAYLEFGTPAWSLHRLLCMLPRCVDGGYHLAISYDHIEYRTTYNEVTTWWRGGGNTYDMIIETIEWLIKEGYFNKEYLV